MTGKIDVRPRLDGEMVAALAESERLYGELGPLPTDDPLAQRRAYSHERAFWNALKPPVASVEPLNIPFADRTVPCRLYRPVAAGKPLAALAYFHGGGWVLGNLDTHDRVMRLLANGSGAAVLGVDYRLAPEHKFPAAYDDALAAVRHLIRAGASLEIDTSRLAVGGDSAGANLALATCLCLNESERRSVRLQLLYYGAFGLVDSASMRAFGNEIDGLTRSALERYRNWLVRDQRDLADYCLDNLSADLRDLPPALVVAAALDPLLDDSRCLADLLTEGDVANRLVIYEGVLHGFLHYSRMMKKAMQALHEGAAALRRAFGGEAG
jgi:acetyl esterase